MTEPLPVSGCNSSRAYQSIFLKSGRAMALLDGARRFRLVNPALLRMLDYEAEELIGKDLTSTLLHPDEASRWEQSGESSFERKWRIRRRDGSLFWANVSISSMQPEEGGFVAVLQDIQDEHEQLEALQESEKQFRLMVEGSEDVFFFQHDADLRITYISPSLKAVTGYEPNEVIGKKFSEFMADAESAKRIEDSCAADPATPELGNSFVVECRHKNGSRLSVEVLQRRYLDSSKKLIVRGFARDVTARRVAEQQLELSDEILQHIHALVLVANGKGQITYISPSVTKLLGFRAAELLGYGWWRHEARNGDQGRKACEIVAAAARGERPYRKEVWEEISFDKAGDPHWLLWQEAKGPADLLIGIAQDITEKKKADEELSRKSLQLRAIFDSAMDGMFIVNNELRYIDVNPAGCTILGRTRDEVLGKFVGDFSLPNSIPFDLWEKVRRDGEFVGKHQVLRPDGTRVEVEISIRADILPGLHLSILRDVTDRLRLEKQFMQSQKMEALGRLAGGVAHDVNNLIMAQRGFQANARAITTFDEITQETINLKR